MCQWDATTLHQQRDWRACLGTIVDTWAVPPYRTASWALTMVGRGLQILVQLITEPSATAIAGATAELGAARRPERLAACNGTTCSTRQGHSLWSDGCSTSVNSATANRTQRDGKNYPLCSCIITL